jgi:hypothetical protein
VYVFLDISYSGFVRIAEDELWQYFLLIVIGDFLNLWVGVVNDMSVKSMPLAVMNDHFNAMMETKEISETLVLTRH